MNKKSLFLGMAAFAIAAFVFVGCDNGATEVEGSVGQYSVGHGAAPGNVQAVKTTDGVKVLISWTAAEKAVGYNVYFQQKDKKPVYSIGNVYSNDTLHIVADGSYAATYNADANAWDTVANSVLDDAYATVSDLVRGKAYKIGVSAIDLQGNESAIAWTSGYVTP